MAFCPTLVAEATAWLVPVKAVVAFPPKHSVRTMSCLALLLMPPSHPATSLSRMDAPLLVLRVPLETVAVAARLHAATVRTPRNARQAANAEKAENAAPP